MSSEDVLKQIDSLISLAKIQFGYEPSRFQIKGKRILLKVIFGDASHYKGVEIVPDDDIPEHKIDDETFQSELLFYPKEF